MGDRGGHLRQRRHARCPRECRLRVAQCLLGVICADLGSNIGTGASITEKIAAGVKKWFAACPDVYRRSNPADGVLEIAKWPMCVEHRPMQSPFLRFRFDVSCNIPSSQAS